MPNMLSEGQKAQAQKTDWFNVLPAAITSADRTSGEFNNPYALGMMVHVILSSITGTPSFVLKLQTKDAEGNAFTWWTASAPFTGSNTYYMVYPAAIANSAFAEIVTFPLPGQWQMVVDYTGTPANDYAQVQVYATYI